MIVDYISLFMSQASNPGKNAITSSRKKEEEGRTLLLREVFFFSSSVRTANGAAAPRWKEQTWEWGALTAGDVFPRLSPD